MNKGGEKMEKMEKEIRVKREWHEECDFWEYDEKGERTYRTYKYAVATCPFCGYECDARLHNDSCTPSLFDDVCEHFHLVDKERDEVIFKEEGASASVYIDPYERY